MGLPHFSLYYWVWNQRLLFWLQIQMLAWLHIEEECCSPTLFNIPIHSYPTASPVVSLLQSLTMWSSVRKPFEWHSGSICAPLITNEFINLN